MNPNFKLIKTVPFRIYLLKFSKNKYKCLISHHHIILDGWSNSLIINEIISAYESLVAGENLVSKYEKLSYKEYLKKIYAQDDQQIREFWKNYFTGINKTFYQKPNSNSNNKKQSFKNHELPLTNDLTKSISEYSKYMMKPISSIFYLAWFILFYKIENSDDIIFHTTFSGRHLKLKGIEKAIGPYINTLPLRMKIGNKSISLLLEEINNMLLSIEDFQLSPVNIVSEYIPGNYNYYNTLMVIENYPRYINEAEANRSISLNSIKYSERTSFDITHIISIEEQWKSKYCFNSDIFNKKDIEYVHEAWVQILEKIVTGTDDELNDFILFDNLNKPVLKLNNLSDQLANEINKKKGILLGQLKNPVQNSGIGEIYIVDQHICNETSYDELKIILNNLSPTDLIGRLNARGKIEKLNKISYAERKFDSGDIESNNKTVQEKLNCIWDEVLGFVPDPKDNFFEIGGDSIKLVRLYKLINHHFPKQIKINDFFENPTIEKLILLIEDNTAKKQEINFIDF